jgi:hypothetical protein
MYALTFTSAPTSIVYTKTDTYDYMAMNALNSNLYLFIDLLYYLLFFISYYINVYLLCIILINLKANKI